MRRSLLYGQAVVLAMLAPLIGPVAADAAPAAQSYYVSGTGSDNNDGRSTAKPFRTIQRAANVTNPGDTVNIMNGSYGDTSVEGVVRITRSGAPGRVITYRALPGHRPVLKPVNGWNGIVLIGASYITIDGLEIRGDSQSMTLAEAIAKASTSEPRYNTNCLNAREDRDTGALSHHLIIRGNYLHHCPGSGIALMYNDHVLVENNRIHSTSWYTVYGTSGISVYAPTDVGTPEQHSPYKVVVRNNISYDNETKVKWIGCNCISDGNGIIIDDTLHSQTNNKAYKGRTLVTNNIVFNNGGTGIHSYLSENVDIVYNTAYHNSRSPAINNPNIGAWFSKNINVLNNISYARPGKSTNLTVGNTNVRHDYNVYFGGLPPQVRGPHDTIADPRFVTASTNPAIANFWLQSGSPAVNSATPFPAVTVDYFGTKRPQGAAPDRGALEQTG